MLFCSFLFVMFQWCDFIFVIFSYFFIQYVFVLLTLELLSMMCQNTFSIVMSENVGCVRNVLFFTLFRLFLTITMGIDLHNRGRSTNPDSVILEQKSKGVNWNLGAVCSLINNTVPIFVLLNTLTILLTQLYAVTTCIFIYFVLRGPVGKFRTM